MVFTFAATSQFTTVVWKLFIGTTGAKLQKRLHEIITHLKWRRVVRASKFIKGRNYSSARLGRRQRPSEHPSNPAGDNVFGINLHESADAASAHDCKWHANNVTLDSQRNPSRRSQLSTKPTLVERRSREREPCKPQSKQHTSQRELIKSGRKPHFHNSIRQQRARLSATHASPSVSNAHTHLALHY